MLLLFNSDVCPVNHAGQHIHSCVEQLSTALQPLRQALQQRQARSVRAEQVRQYGPILQQGVPTSRWSLAVWKLTDCTGAGQAATTDAMGGGTSSCCSGVSSSRAPSTTAAVPRWLHGHHSDILGSVPWLDIVHRSTMHLSWCGSTLLLMLSKDPRHKVGMGSHRLVDMYWHAAV
jgi:hypothetical protein